MPCLASDRNMQPRALQQTCGLSDKNIRHGLTLQESTCNPDQYKASSWCQAKKIQLYLLLASQLGGSIGAGNSGID